MKLAIFEINGWEKTYLKQKLKNHELQFFSENIDKNHLKKIKNCEILSVFIYSKIDKKILSTLPKLKLITTRSTGFDHIDLKECKKRNISVCNVPFYGENTVAEHTFALILSLSRHIHKSYIRTIRGDYSIEGLQGFDLKGKTIGIVGAGRIGLHVIRMAKGFGMDVLAHDVNQDNFLSEVLDFKYTSLENLLKKSDIISLHVPYNKKTHHLINRQNIHLIKKNALLINTSRGGNIDTDALLEALEKNIIRGAGLDVIEGEELIKEEEELIHDKNKQKHLNLLIKDHLILNKENVVFTPHLAFYSKEALQRILDTTQINIESFIKKIPSNLLI